MEQEQLLQDYIAADGKRRETNGTWGHQWEINNKLNELGYYVYYHYKNTGDYSQYYLEKRQGYWGSRKRWNNDRIVEG